MGSSPIIKLLEKFKYRIFWVFSHISHKIYGEILPEKLRVTYTRRYPGHKMNWNFFQPLKHATSDPTYCVDGAAEMMNSAMTMLSTTTTTLQLMNLTTMTLSTLMTTTTHRRDDELDDDDTVFDNDGEDFADLLHLVQVLKNHLRLIQGSMIWDHIRTRFLGRWLIHGSNLYASIYGS